MIKCRSANTQLAAMIDVLRPTPKQVLPDSELLSLLKILIFFFLLKYLTLETCEHKPDSRLPAVAATFI